MAKYTIYELCAKRIDNINISDKNTDYCRQNCDKGLSWTNCKKPGRYKQR